MNKPSSDSVIDRGDSNGGLNLSLLFGRIGRVQFVGFCFSAQLILLVLLFVTLGIVESYTPTINRNEEAENLVFLLFGIVSSVIYLNLVVRRLHDLQHSAWYALLAIVPFINLALFLYLAFAPGVIGDNQYGREPAPSTQNQLAISIVVVIFFIAAVIHSVTYPSYAIE